MTSTTFIDKTTLIEAPWLNDVDALVYQGQLDDGTTGASISRYLPAGTGAVATTVQAKQRESVSVNDYGANPSATAAVNAAAIQAAIDENPVVFLPAGAHNINATITIPDGHTFFGISEYASILVQTGDCDGITNANVTTGGKNILVENIGIHLGTAPSANSRVGLYLAGSSYSKYHNIHCKFFETSVWLNRPIPGVAAWFNSFENIRGEVCKYGVKSYSATNSINSNWFNNITITDTGGFSGGYGLWVNGYGNSFSNLYLAVSSGVAGVYVDTVAGANVFKNIYVESAPTHTIWNNSGTIRVNTFIGVYSDGVPAVITDTAGNGIFISSDDVRLGNTVEVGSFHSVYSDGTLTVKVSDNTEGMKVTASAANSRTNLTIENTGTAGAAWKLQTSGSGFYGSDAGALRLLHNGVHKFTFSSSFALNPATTNTQDLGKSTLLWANAYVTTLRPGAGTVQWTSGSGSPEGVLTAVIGSLYTRTNGGAGTTLYVKESGISNTGWIAK